MDLRWILPVTLQLTLYLTGIHTQSAERDIDICEPKPESRARMVHLHSPSFPDMPDRNRHCNCSLRSSNQLDLNATLRVFLSSSVTSLIVKYRDMNDTVTWTGDAQDFMSRDLTMGGFLITVSTADVEVIYKTKPNLKSIFAIDISGADRSDILMFSCSELPVSQDDDTPDTTNVAFKEIERFCNAYVLIILASLCATFFVILIFLAICLCCTVRKRSDYLRQSSDRGGQPLSNQSSLGLPMESYRVASRIYDDGAAGRASMNGEHYATPRRHSLPAIRESLGYANADMLKAECDAAGVSLYGNF